MAAESNSKSDILTLEKVREALIKQEDTIISRLIQRANFPLNSPAYDEGKFPSFPGSLLQFVVKETEALQSKVIMLMLHFHNLRLEINFRETGISR